MKLASINIERSKHLKEVSDFVRSYNPDVLLLQELCERDIGLFEDLMGEYGLYAPVVLHPAEEELEPMGVMIIAKMPLTQTSTQYYTGNGLRMEPIAMEIDEKGRTVVDASTNHRCLVSADIEGFRIGTTHFTWSADGEATPQQLLDVENLLLAAKAEASRGHGYLFAGDLNAPRGRTTFSRIAQNFTDAIPAHYTGSIDGTFHRAGNLPLMVDGLFHTPHYKVTNVLLNKGISDHMAITATVEKA
jgi:exonuclease III